jgi:2-hydroxychromene-2-carboxylate isomerase
MASIDYWFSLASPWAFLGHDPLLKLAKAHDASVVYKPVFLPDVFKETGGVPLPQRAPARQRYRMLELQRWREFRGVPLKLRPKHWPFDPKPGDCCVTAIVEAGGDPSGASCAPSGTPAGSPRRIVCRERSSPSSCRRPGMMPRT